MRIVLVISSLNAGGAERVLSGLANHFASHNHHVSLVTLAHPDTIPFYDLHPSICLLQLNQNQVGTNPLERLLNIVKRLWHLRKTFKKLHPDIIISFIDVVNLNTLMAAAGLKIPVIVSERTDPAFYHIPFIYEKIRTLLYPLAKKVIVQTSAASDYFKNLPNKVIIPNAVAKPLQVKNSSTEVYEIISVGRLCPFKGFTTLIRAFAQIIQKHPDLQLTIYGEGPERHHLEKLIRDLRLEKKVSLPGVTKDIQTALRQAVLFVFPSLYEGFPNALCEAMAVGLPVIASDCSGNTDVVRDHLDGRLFPVGDVDQLKALMEELIHDPEQRNRLGIEAQTICQRFHPDIIFKFWDNIIDDTLKRHHP